MLKYVGAVAATTLAVMLASQQANALSFNIEGGKNYEGANVTQSFTPLFRGSLGYAHSDHHDSGANLFTGSLMFTPYVPGLDVGLGGRYQYQHTHYGNGGGLGLGGYVYVPISPLPFLSVGGDAYYTPNGLTQGSVKSSFEYDARLRFRLVSQTYAFVGYHHQKTKFDNSGSHSYFSGPQIGLSVGF